MLNKTKSNSASKVRVTQSRDQWSKLLDALSGRTCPILTRAVPVIASVVAGNFDHRSGVSQSGDLWIESNLDAWHSLVSALCDIGVECLAIRSSLYAVEALQDLERKERLQPRKLCSCRPGECLQVVSVHIACRRALEMQVGEIE
jgi:hypothetical protein